jgi:hypothetical protein
MDGERSTGAHLALDSDAAAERDDEPTHDDRDLRRGGGAGSVHAMDGVGAARPTGTVPAAGGISAARHTGTVPAGPQVLLACAGDRNG